MNQNFLFAGIACIIAAIVGGGLKAFGFEIPILNSIGRQILLALVGVILILFGIRTIPPSNSAKDDKIPASTIHTTDNVDQGAGKQPGMQRQDPLPQEKIIVEASPNPYSITAGDQAEIDVLAYTADKTPVANAKVELGAGGGFFSISGNYIELGATNDNGIFKTYWKAPDPATSAYGINVTVSKNGFIEGRKEITVNVVNH